MGGILNVKRTQSLRRFMTSHKRDGVHAWLNGGDNSIVSGWGNGGTARPLSLVPPAIAYGHPGRSKGLLTGSRFGAGVLAEGLAPVRTKSPGPHEEVAFCFGAKNFPSMMCIFSSERFVWLLASRLFSLR